MKSIINLKVYNNIVSILRILQSKFSVTVRRKMLNIRFTSNTNILIYIPIILLTLNTCVINMNINAVHC